MQGYIADAVIYHGTAWPRARWRALTFGKEHTLKHLRTLGIKRMWTGELRAAATEAANAPPRPKELWEHQRFYYAFGWNAPFLPLDEPPRWSDSQGASVPDEFSPQALLTGVTGGEQQARERGADGGTRAASEAESWVVEVTPATDNQGWQYATGFLQLGEPREGGRAAKRNSDFVRRRKWLRRCAADAAAATQRSPTRAGGSSSRSFVSAADVVHLSHTDAAAADASARARGASTARTAWRAFFGMLQEAAARRGGLFTVPFDPISWGSVYSAHSTWLANTQALLLSDRLPLAPDSAPATGGAPEDATEEGPEVAAAGAPGAVGGNSAARAGPEGGAAVTPALLRDFASAVDFARAAYGYAFLTGGMSSIYRYLHMQTLQRSSFDIIAGASSEANNQAVCAIAGVPMEDVLFAEWRNTTYRPCHILAVDRRRDRLVLAIRGSLELGDLLTDLHAKPIEVTLGGVECRVHEGMLRAAAYVHANCADALAAAAAGEPRLPLLVTGHSLGGGVAALVTVLLQQPGGAPEALQERGVRCVTVGTGASMSSELAAACEPYVASLVLAADVVPRLSYHSIERLLTELEDKSPAANFAASFRTQVAATFAPLTGGADKAGAAAAAKHSSGAAAEAARDSTRLAPEEPGADDKGVELAEMPSSEGFSALAAPGLGGGARNHRGSVDAAAVGAQAAAAHAGASVTAQSSTGDSDGSTDGGASRSRTLRSADTEPGPAAEVQQDARRRDARRRAGDVALADAAMDADGMAAAPSDEPPSVWQKLLQPVMAFVTPRGGGDGRPFTDEAMAQRVRSKRAKAEEERAAAAAAAAEVPSSPEDLPVDDPLAYLHSTGLASPSARGAREEAVGAAREALERDAPPPPPLGHAPSGVQRLDEEVLKRADQGHAAAAAADTAEAPPPLYPPGRIFWLVPLRTKKGGAAGRAGGDPAAAAAAGGLGLPAPEDMETASSGVLPAHPMRLLAQDVFGQSGGGVNLGAGRESHGGVAAEGARAAHDRDSSSGGARSLDTMPDGAGAGAVDSSGEGVDPLATGSVSEQYMDFLGPGPCPSQPPAEMSDWGASVAGDVWRSLHDHDVPGSPEPGRSEGDVPETPGQRGLAQPRRDGSETETGAAAAGAAAAAATGEEGSGGNTGAGLGAPAAVAEAPGPSLAPGGGFTGPDARAGAASAGAGAGAASFVVELAAPGERIAAGGGAKGPPGDVDVAVVDATARREAFNYLTLSADMIQDHLPDSYTRAVALLHVQMRALEEQG